MAKWWQVDVFPEDDLTKKVKITVIILAILSSAAGFAVAFIVAGFPTEADLSRSSTTTEVS